MNNNNKLFGVLIVALFAFGATGGASAQNGYNTFVALGDWEYDIGDQNVRELCELHKGCSIYTTDNVYTKGDLYLANSSSATRDVDEGDLRLYSKNGFEAGSIVMDDDADEGAVLNIDTTPNVTFIQSVADDELQSAELNALFIGNGTNDKVAEDDVDLTNNVRVDEDDEREDAVLTPGNWMIYYADLDAGKDYDAGEPLFADVDNDNKISVGDLIFSGDDFLSLVTADHPYLSNPTLLPINTTTRGTNNGYFLAIQDEQTDYEENGYRGEALMLVRNATGFTEPRIGNESFVLTGDSRGQMIDDGHPLHEEDFADTNKTQFTKNDEAVRFCILTADDEEPATHNSMVVLHFDTACSGDADDGDINIITGEALADSVDGELKDYARGAFNGTIGNTTPDASATNANGAWFIMDLNGDGEINDGEPIVLDADFTGTLTTLDLIISEDGAQLAGPGYGHMAPDVDTLAMVNGGTATLTGLQTAFCTFYYETEDENGDDLWVASALMLRSSTVATSEEDDCKNENEPVYGDFVLSGSDANVGGFLSDDAAGLYDGEFATDSATQPDYKVYFDDLFPSGFGPEDVIFMTPSTDPKIDEGTFYLGGPALVDGDDYFETDIDDLETLTSVQWALIEGDDEVGLSTSDWFYLVENSANSIDDTTLVIYKAGASAPVDTVDPVVDPVVDPGNETVDPEDQGNGTVDPEETQKQPGFEAIALVAALGAALVLVRRRN